MSGWRWSILWDNVQGRGSIETNVHRSFSLPRGLVGRRAADLRHCGRVHGSSGCYDPLRGLSHHGGNSTHGVQSMESTRWGKNHMRHCKKIFLHIKIVLYS